MRNAKFDYIAFLDADDFYLPGRFMIASEIFQKYPACEGVYEAVTMQVESEAGMSRWQEAGKSTTTLQTMSAAIPPDELAEALIQGGRGYFQLNGLVIRKAVLKQSGFMNENLRMHQDTEFILRVALTSRLFPGRLDTPVAMWRVHQANRVSAPRSLAVQYRDRMKYWRCLYNWVRQNGTPKQGLLVRNGIFSYYRSTKILSFPKRILPTKVIIFGRQLRLLTWPQLLIDHAAQAVRTTKG